MLGGRERPPCPGARLVVVADLDGACALATRHGADAVDDPLAALTRGEVHAACIVTPNHQHALLAHPAGRRGVAVLVEKPLGRDGTEPQAIVDTCAAQGVPLGMVLQNRSCRGAPRPCSSPPPPPPWSSLRGSNSSARRAAPRSWSPVGGQGLAGSSEPGGL